VSGCRSPCRFSSGFFLGLYLDRRFGTDPYLMFVFLGLGIAAGYRNIALAIRKARKY
jgi:ATP synthase protein I